MANKVAATSRNLASSMRRRHFNRFRMMSSDARYQEIPDDNYRHGNTVIEFTEVFRGVVNCRHLLFQK